ncbi:MAG: enoyl-CoA hydratase-related protein, partial [Actinomycetota bacterium]
NAWTTAMEVGYFDLLEQAAADAEVRVIIVTGAGRGFCSGADMEDLRDTDREANARRRAERPMTFPLRIPKPVIGAINGACAGLGLAQALMCDLRFAAAGAKFTTAFSRLGLPAEHGTAWHLTELVGMSVALDLLYSSRVVLAEEALELGLVNRVAQPDQLMATTREYARALAEQASPSSMAAMKRQVYWGREDERAASLARSYELQASALQDEDFDEGVRAFKERRKPAFRPLPRS